MRHNTVIAADIAKNSFHCATFVDGQLVGKCRNHSRASFIKLITRPRPVKIVMESCSGAQHWRRLAESHGHEVVLVPPKLAAGYRQGQKTDKNDTFAIYEASRSVKLKPAVNHDVQTQGLAVLDATRTHYQTRKTALSNAIRGHLSEFGIVLPKGFSHLKKHLPEILEDADNELPDSARIALNLYWQDWQTIADKVAHLDQAIATELTTNPAAKQIAKIEGLGPVCSAQILIALGDGSAFTKGSDASAFVGLTPKQHSTGGKVTLIGIGKHVGHRKLRSNAIQGARSVIQKVKGREPVSDLDHWLTSLIERAGENRAAVALANKNIRRAWKLLAHGGKFQANYH